jgi:hypothetical protein
MITFMGIKETGGIQIDETGKQFYRYFNFVDAIFMAYALNIICEGTWEVMTKTDAFGGYILTRENNSLQNDK